MVISTAMLHSLKEKFFSVQDEISASLKGVKIGGTPHSNPLRREIELNAGVKLLSVFQASWENIHTLSEENAKQFQMVDQLIDEHYGYMKKHNEKLSKFNHNLSGLGDLINLTEKAVNSIGEIRCLINEINSKCIDFEDLVESEEQITKMEGSSDKLTEYRKEKLLSMDRLRATLAEDYEKKVRLHEEEYAKVRKHRSEVAEKKFKEDLEAYKAMGVLPKPDSPSSPVKLEEIEIEQDLDSLNDYLS